VLIVHSSIDFSQKILLSFFKKLCIDEEVNSSSIKTFYYFTIIWVGLGGLVNWRTF
jgi:hypothetical protein